MKGNSINNNEEELINLINRLEIKEEVISNIDEPEEIQGDNLQ